MSEPFASLLPDAVVIAVADPADVDEALFDEEEAMIARAVEKRRREFAAGRSCARQALAALGVPAQALVNGDDRAPLWPQGVVGSIAHTRGYCVVAVARDAELESLGVDVELDEPVKEALWDRICTPDELASFAEAERGRLVRLAFSAKEAFYKCQYPVTRQYLGFHDVRLEVDLPASRFAIQLQRAAGRFAAGTRFDGRLDVSRGYVRTAMAWRP